jgi:hypothetical protein
MSTLGKVLAILNGVAALGFFIVAALDYGQHHAWTTAVFQQEVILNGLPVDENEVDVEGRPIATLLNKNILQKLFTGAGQPVRTQKEEVKKRHDALLAQIDSKPALEAILVPLKQTLGEREELHRLIAKTPLEDLKGPDGPFEAAFKEAQGGKSIQGWKEDIAKVLCGTAQTQEEQQRAMIVVGMEMYVHAVDEQAALVAAMAPQLRMLISQDRAAWEVQHKAVMQQIIALSERIHTLEEMLAKQQELRDKHHQALVQARQNDVTELTQNIAKTRQKLTTELSRQGALETELFTTEKAVAVTEANNERLEREIRSRETAR